ncbi:polyribonucleotide nucleotidyltransferase [Enterococcus ureilyticus]|nr:polyribonucleotide nucleotidyltransferase [Enterococcus ureilyticus]
MNVKKDEFEVRELSDGVVQLIMDAKKNVLTKRRILRCLCLIKRLRMYILGLLID